MSDNSDEKYLAGAIRYLMETGHSDIGRLLLSCEIEVSERYFEEDAYYAITLLGSPAFYQKYQQDMSDDGEHEGAFRSALQDAFNAVLPGHYPTLHVGVGVTDFDIDWRTRLLAEHETQETADNQNSFAKKPIVWNGMKFNSHAEIKIAQALEHVGVTYFPNCLVRVGAPNNQQTLFPDFLICYRGKWGILEVDGQSYHQGTATQDFERMRKLFQHVAYFDRYPANRCTSEPDKVVSEFLEILGNR